MKTKISIKIGMLISAGLLVSQSVSLVLFSLNMKGLAEVRVQDRLVQ